jgi:uncharacterized damage-inducible protein DinB
MFRNTTDFLTEWVYESEATLNVFKKITNEALNKKDYENVRSIANLCWHITITLNEMMNKTGLSVEGPEEHSKAPDTIEEIIDAYEKSARSVTEQVEKQWNDSVLLDEVYLYGENWKNGITLSVLIKHQVHHRGQLSVLMRQSGLKVPSVYGPVKEDWAKFNLPPAE